MERRQFLAGSSALAALTIARPAAAFTAAPASGADLALDGLFGRIFNDTLALSPESVSSLGLDKGDWAAMKSQLDDRTEAGVSAGVTQTRQALADLAKVDRAALSPASLLNLDVVNYQLETRLDSPRLKVDAVQRPYRLYQQGGAYFSLPDFLDSRHTIETAADAEAYLARLALVGRALDEDTAEQKAQAARGLVAPGWSLDLTLGQMQKLRAVAAGENTMVGSLVRRAAAKGIPGDWKARAEKIVAGTVYPALDRQIALVQQLRGQTQPGDGAWRLPNGDAIYAAALRQATTTEFSPEEVHRIGLDQVADLTAKLDAVLKAAGMTKGTVGERLAALNVQPDQLYPNTDEGRATLIASLNAGVARMTGLLPRAFATLPGQPLEIRRVPVEIQDGASNGYYYRAALDGSRPAIYWINLKDVGDWPKYSLPSLTYHEGVPGHHLQISIAQTSKDIPMLRKIGGFSAYSEGWALYSEQLADELGAYDGIEKAGYLQSFLFRAARLVIDTGLHTKRWSREQATDYMVATTGFARPRSQREVERYCTMIGQACSYKMGHIAWTRAREKAQKALGPKFDVKHFHEVLREGAMPLSILEKRIDERTAAALRG
ncbi:DUF885 family protein [Novosphingobium sp. KCTC 2891]|uniref:DUF885 domain-containing protein n=1 Tax=Novosphingobium sp. KCTC 2891 TaxID=2989730 RepID=UPI002223AB1A|nr:DUF885 family protein [Novosphingobium sp. KCTC 2891]MCW1384109.1 DUF885 family protein [Novosphingobium sp. KCTC 2891]